MSRTILTPLSSGLYTNGRGVPYFYPLLDIRDHRSYGPGFRLGDCESLAVQINVTDTKRFSNEYAVKTLAATMIDEVEATVTLSSVQLSPLVRAAALMGKEGKFSQGAVTSELRSFAEPGTYFLGVHALSDVTVMRSSDLELATAGVDYTVDLASGQIEVITPGLDVTFSAVEINDRFATGIASGTGIRGMMLHTGTNAQGVRSILRLHDVELRPSGARDFISSSSDPQAIELIGTAYPVSGEPEGYEIGYEIDA